MSTETIIEVGVEEYQRILVALENPPAPSQALIDLMKSGDGGSVGIGDGGSGC